MKTTLPKLSILISTCIALHLPVSAQDPFDFAAVDLLLGVQATAGTGTSTNVFFNLGTTMSFRDGTNPEILGNIGQDLADAFNSNWFERADVRFGVAGLRSQFTDTLDPPQAGEDSGRRWYVSRATTQPGQANPWSALNGNSLQLGGNDFKSLAGIFVQGELGNRLLKTPSGATVLNQVEEPVRWSNSWSSWNPSSGASFSIWSGGIENNFGQGGNRVLVDVQLVRPSNAGTYVVTIAIESDGTIRAIRPSTGSTPFEDWVATFPALVSSPKAADRAPEGDFDKDGVPNIREFGFGGSPVSSSDNGQQQIRTVDANGDSQGDLTLTVEVLSGATFSPSGNKLTATHDGVVYTIEGSLDLVTFESAVSEVTPTLGTGTPKTGYVFKTFRLNASAGLSGTGFIRAGAAVAP